MQVETLKKLGTTIVIVVPIAIVIACIFDQISALDYFGVYFIYPFFIYIPLCAFIITALMFIVSIFIKDNKVVKCVFYVMLCTLIAYLVICFGIIGYSSKKADVCEKVMNINQSFNITNMSEANNAFEGAEISYEDEEKMAFGNALLYSYDYFFDVNTDEDALSGDVIIYYFEKVPLLNRKKLLNQINATYFGYELDNHNMTEDDIIHKQSGQMQYQYCYGETFISYGDLRRQAYFAVLIEDKDKIIWGAISFGHKQKFDFDAEKVVDNLMETMAKTGDGVKPLKKSD